MFARCWNLKPLFFVTPAEGSRNRQTYNVALFEVKMTRAYPKDSVPGTL